MTQGPCGLFRRLDNKIWELNKTMLNHSLRMKGNCANVINKITKKNKKKMMMMMSAMETSPNQMKFQSNRTMFNSHKLSSILRFTMFRRSDPWPSLQKK